MRCCAVFFMGNIFSDLEDLLIPFLDSSTLPRPIHNRGRLRNLPYTI